MDYFVHNQVCPPNVTLVSTSGGGEPISGWQVGRVDSQGNPLDLGTITADWDTPVGALSPIIEVGSVLDPDLKLRNVNVVDIPAPSTVRHTGILLNLTGSVFGRARCVPTATGLGGLISGKVAREAWKVVAEAIGLGIGAGTLELGQLQQVILGTLYAGSSLETDELKGGGVIINGPLNGTIHVKRNPQSTVSLSLGALKATVTVHEDGGSNSAILADGDMVGFAPNPPVAIRINGGMAGDIIADADGDGDGAITGRVIVTGTFDGNICGSNLSPGGLLPSNIEFGAIGPNTTICGSPDCNTNGIPDASDVTSGTSADCNVNQKPDECDLAFGTSQDCNANGVPDECDPDGDADGVIDPCDNCPSDPNADQANCNQIGAGDVCRITSGTSADCNMNALPDECDVNVLDPDGNGVVSADCNLNATPDECESQADCNGNSIQDICDIAAGTSEDCQSNGVPDECDADCQPNGTPDDCDIADGTSVDSQPNGVPDECEPVLSPLPAGAPHDIRKNRFISFDPSNIPVAVACVDAITCTVDSCNEGTDSCDNTPDNASCNDGLFCNGVETCDSQTDCQAGSDPCPGQQCDEATDTCGCFNDADCDDGLFCDGTETCVGGTCQSGTAVDCNDGNVCTDDSCVSGTCQHTNNAGSCSDGNACTIDDVCSGGVCTSGLAMLCLFPQVCNTQTGVCQ